MIKKLSVQIRSYCFLSEPGKLRLSHISLILNLGLIEFSLLYTGDRNLQPNSEPVQEGVDVSVKTLVSLVHHLVFGTGFSYVTVKEVTKNVHVKIKCPKKQGRGTLTKISHSNLTDGRVTRYLYSCTSLSCIGWVS